MEACQRCGGAGRYAFDGHSDTCYLCRGQNSWVRKDHGQSTPELAQIEHGKVLARRAADRTRREGKAEIARQERHAQAWAVRDALAPLFDAHPLAVDATYYPNLEAAGASARELRGYAFAYERWHSGRGLTDRVLSICAEHTGRLVAAANRVGTVAPLEAGRRELSGTVGSVTWKESDYGTTRKITVLLDSGHRIYGTAPRSLANLHDDELKGAAVTLTATVEPTDDPEFGWFSRPTKATATPAVV